MDQIGFTPKIIFKNLSCGVVKKSSVFILILSILKSDDCEIIYRINIQLSGVFFLHEKHSR